MFLATILFAGLPFSSLNHQTLPPSTNDFYFIAMGDNRPAGAGLPPTSTFRSLLNEVATIAPAFVISSGDIFYGNEETLDQYKTEEAEMRPLIDSLPCPFYNAPGNHEINNRPEFLAEYTANWGAPYGSFEYGGLRFIAVCSELPADRPSIFGEQKTWLQGLFSDKKPSVVFQHHPVFARSTNTDPKEDSVIKDSEAVHAMYRDGGVKLVVEGHDHIYDRQEHDGIPYIIAGGGGAPLDGPTNVGGFFHFLLIHVSDGKIEATPVPMGTLDVVSLPDGTTAAANYADVDLPVTNVLIHSAQEPKSVTGAYTTKKGKPKDVPAKIVSVQKQADGYQVRVALTLPKHRATILKLGY